MRRPIGLLCALMMLACSTPEPSAALPADTHEDTPEDTSGPHIRFVHAPSGDVASAVQQFVAEAEAESRTPLVYVGATWCEPCRYFHQAAEAGSLDGSLPRLALLEFDRDQDNERLVAVGYSSRLIPLFVVPGDDGRGTDRQIEGSIHGAGSPQEIAPRLRAILQR